jgi:hypothetical protein
MKMIIEGEGEVTDISAPEKLAQGVVDGEPAHLGTICLRCRQIVRILYQRIVADVGDIVEVKGSAKGIVIDDDARDRNDEQREKPHNPSA